ncbi:MAG TPA: DUF192 domain-containing protein [Candidatus Norongarragalinales archaeon]|jgi:uncharacterized membrane protein (UPF0127 family)|nr:DUF192 domain-containing protein [Candidatus Norongarragalinales archaeon]
MSRELWRAFEACDTPLKRAKGLLFRASFEKPLLFNDFPKYESIHSFFCPPFDAVFLDEDKKITQVFNNVLANRLVTPSRPSAFLIETPAGDARRKHLRVGMRLQWTRGGSISLLKDYSTSKSVSSRQKKKR